MTETANRGVDASAIYPGMFGHDPDAFEGLSVSEVVREWSIQIPDEVAFATTEGAATWAEYDRAADRIASAISAVLNPIGALDDAASEATAVAVYLPDTMLVHAAFCGSYRAGRITMGIGSRSGISEVAHLMRQSGSRLLVTSTALRGRGWRELVEDLWRTGAEPDDVIVVGDDGAVELYDGRFPGAGPRHVSARVFAARSAVASTTDLSLLNSTSGTTGLPKIVMHNERKWVEFAKLAMLGGEITRKDVVCSAVPAPFGFGLWSAHFLPALLGVPTAVMGRFDVDAMIDLLERQRVTVLCCVSTQFKMLLRAARIGEADLSRLRVLYTGGEAVPYADALAFERRTGAKVLQFYGSNEAGAVSQTTLAQDTETRLRTSGQVISSMNIRLFDDTGGEIVASEAGRRRRGQPAVHGPTQSQGYWRDDAANAELHTADGWLLLGDIVEIDESGRLTVVGRKADIIIRGGKNISAVEIERLVAGHPAVREVAVVGVADEVFGERVCAVVVLEQGQALATAALSQWLRERGTTVEYLPEYVVQVDDLPRAPGGKIAKGIVKDIARVRVAPLRVSS